MSKSIKVDILYGFKTKIELSNEEIDELYSKKIIASPICYSTEDQVDEYLVGKFLQSLTSAGQFEKLKELTEEQKEQKKKELFEDLNELGFDVAEKPCEVYINTYYF